MWTIWSLLNNSYFFNSVVNDRATLDRSLVDEVLHLLIFGAVILLLSFNLLGFHLVRTDNIPSITILRAFFIWPMDLVFRFLVLVAVLLLLIVFKEGPVPRGHFLQFRCTISTSCLFRARFLATNETLWATTAFLAHATQVTFGIVGWQGPLVPNCTGYHAMHRGLIRIFIVRLLGWSLFALALHLDHANLFMVNQKRLGDIVILFIIVDKVNWEHGGSHCVLLLNDKALSDIDIDALLALSFNFRWLVTDGRGCSLTFNKITLDSIILALLLQSLMFKLKVLVGSHRHIFTFRLVALLLHIQWWWRTLLSFLAA